ncbi:unnamed protein product, partial [Strongylus vulgaris]
MLIIGTICLIIYVHAVSAECNIVDRKTYLKETFSLYNALFSNYSAKLPAVAMQEINSTINTAANLTVFDVSLNLVYMKLVQIVEPEQKAEFLFEYAVNWRDERLEWDPKDHCGIEFMYVAASEVWIPEITIVDSHSSEDYRDDYKKFIWVGFETHQGPKLNCIFSLLFQLNATGHLTFFVPTRTATVCTINVQNFPFDHQECAISIMTQTFSAHELRIRLGLIPAL